MNTLFEKSDCLNSPLEAFFFDSNHEYYPVKAHWHYFCEMLYILNGTGYVLCNKKEYAVKPGDFVFFHPQAVHAIYGGNPIQYNVIKFDIGLLKPAGSHISSFSRIFTGTAGDTKTPIIIKESAFGDLSVKNIFDDCIKEISEKQYGYDLCVQSHLTNLLTHILRIWRSCGFDTDKAAQLPSDSQALYSIAEYIDENLGQPLRVEDLAGKCNMSYSYFAKRFHALYGRSCKEYIEFIRISRAKDLLLFTDFDLSFISQETGFSDCSHLIRTFKKIECITPKQYRLRHGKPALDYHGKAQQI